MTKLKLLHKINLFLLSLTVASTIYVTAEEKSFNATRSVETGTGTETTTFSGENNTVSTSVTRNFATEDTHMKLNIRGITKEA